MNTSDLRAAAASFGRVLGPCVVAAYAAVGDTDLSSWGTDDLRTFGWAAASAFGLTVINWLREGETRFGNKPEGHEA